MKVWPEYLYSNQSAEIRTSKSINENMNISRPLPLQGNKPISRFDFKKISKGKQMPKYTQAWEILIPTPYIFKSLDNEH